MFSEEEITYLQGQRLARVATVSGKGQPDVAVVGFEFDGEAFYIGGRFNPGTIKYQNILKGNTRVALVVDDLVSVNPWRPRGIKIHGTAELLERQGHLGPGQYIRVTPTKHWSWGIEQQTQGYNMRKVDWSTAAANSGT